MVCLNCKRIIKQKRTIKTMFRKITVHICDNCLKKYPLVITHEVFPTTYGQVFVFSLINEQNKVKNFSAYMGHMAIFYQWFIDKKGIMLIFDEVDADLLDIIQDITFGDIFLITYKKLKIKGCEIYEI